MHSSQVPRVVLDNRLLSLVPLLVFFSVSLELVWSLDYALQPPALCVYWRNYIKPSPRLKLGRLSLYITLYNFYYLCLVFLSQDSTLYIEHYSGRLGRLSVLVAVTQVYPISYSTLHIPRQLDNKQSRRIVDIKPICNSTVTELELAEWTGQQHL
jgi:hypothetical protein